MSKISDIEYAETKFAYDQIIDFIPSDKNNFRVLEVGCGNGSLLNLLSQMFINVQFFGLEPFNNGFEKNKINSYNHIENKNLEINHISYEDYDTNKQFDLIYLFNVFEHLKDWRHFIKNLPLLLKKNGRCVILCPNYGFPYESHFKIPIIFNKKITKFFFMFFIEKYETSNSSKGLWESLNFVKKKEVIKFVLSEKFELEDRLEIIKDLVKRLDKDKNFKKRQNLIGKISKVLEALNLLKIFNLPLLRNFAPYMKLIIYKK